MKYDYLMILMVSTLVSLNISPPPVFAQGSLTPTGAPGTTMKTLTQIEPRIPISSLPYTITNSGSYYLTANLSSSGHGIVIQASGVSVNLMGFSLTGNRGPSYYGLWLNGATNVPLRDIVVMGGMINNFGRGGKFDCTQNSRLADLVISSNSQYGIIIHGDPLGPFDGNTISGCTISGTAGPGSGISFDGECNANTIANCTILGNSGYGIIVVSYLGSCNGNSVRDCIIRNNGSDGIYFHGYSDPCSGNSVRDCIVSDNHQYGIRFLTANGNRIENNHVTGTTGSPQSWGIYSSGSTNNFILKNTCVGQLNNFAISPDDTYGPIVTSSGSLSTTNGAPTLSPWANLSR